jgi:hypothetical protein
MASKVVKGAYVLGCSHSGRRPKLYDSLGLYRGSINIQLPQGTDESSIIPVLEVPGLDSFDLTENQNFLIRRCRLKGVEGYQILPIDKTTGKPRGHHAEKVIEIALREKIDIKPNEELEVELEGFQR